MEMRGPVNISIQLGKVKNQATLFPMHKDTYIIVTTEYGLGQLICFEAWAKLAQQWLVCAPLGIHLEPINKELMLLVII